MKRDRSKLIGKIIEKFGSRRVYAEKLGMKEIGIRNGEVIAAEINYIKKKTQETVLSAAVEIGRLLCEAKNTVQYGEWGKWLEENVDYSVSTANNLMRLFSEYGEKDQQSLFEDNSTELFAMLSPSQALVLTALPKSERVEFVEEHDMGNLSVRKLQEEIDQIKKEKAEAERRSQSDFETLKKELEAEKAAQKLAKAALKTAQSEASTANKTIDDLKAQLAEAPKGIAEAPKGIIVEQMGIDAETVRDELETKLETKYTEKIRALEAKNAEQAEEVQALTSKLSVASSAAVQKFSVHFNLWQEEYQTLVKLLGEIKSEAPDKLEKFRSAMTSIANKMANQ